jgi:hypothetical protein
MQALKASYEKELASRDEQGEEGKKAIVRQLHDLQSQFEEERKLRSSISAGKKKLEAELADVITQLNMESKAKDEALKYQKKVQVCTVCISVLCHLWTLSAPTTCLRVVGIQIVG